MKNRLHFNNFGKATLFFLLFIFNFSFSYGQLSGTYTINPSGSGSTNFTSFTNAVSALSSSGISGPVVFNVADGVYQEQVTIHTVKGSSSTNTITFQSAGGDSSKAVLTDTLGVNNYAIANYTLSLDSVSFLTFKQITIQQTGSYGHEVVLINSPKGCSFLNDQILGKNSYQGLLISHGDSGNMYKNNLFKSYFSFFDNWNDTGIVKYETNLIFENNIDSSGGAVFISNTSGLNISGNTFKNSQIAIAIENCKNNIIVTKNKIYCTGDGMDMINCTGTSKSPGNISNNTIICGSGYGFGIDIEGDSNLCIAYNTVNCTSQTGLTAIGIFNSYSGGQNKFINNNLVNNAYGYCITLDSAVKADTINYNNLYTNGSALAMYDTLNLDSLSNWQKATGFDLNSVSVNPWFASDTSTFSANPLLVNGIPIKEVTDDYNGDPRSNTIPTIGAFEINPPLNDAVVYSIDSLPVGLCFNNTNIKVYATISNLGSKALTSSKIYWTVNGSSQPDTTWTGNLAPGYNAPSFNIGSYKFLPNTVYTVKVFASIPNGKPGPGNTNDTITKTIELALNGTYTIGGAGANFPDFASAAHTLNKYGICGPVVFNVANGVYKDSFELLNIVGSSPSNSITFQSASGDSTKVIIETDHDSIILAIYNVWYITFKEMSFVYTGPSKNGSYISIYANNVNLINNSFSGINLDIEDCNITFKNNYMHRGVGGISELQCTGPFSSNIIDSLYSGIAISGNNGDDTIESNIITGSVITIETGILYILKNKLTGGGISMSDVFTQLNYGSSLIANNFFSSCGINAINDSNVIIANNNFSEGTIMSEGPNSYEGTIAVINNNFMSKAGGPYIIFNTPYWYNFNQCDYNNYYVVNSSPVVYNYGLNYTLKYWQDSFLFDLHSLTVNPFYVSSTNLTSTNDSLAGKGTSLNTYGIYDDINGTPRPNAPAIGANELSCPNCVWPGDANHDKIADTNDVLYIGIAYGATGATRPDTSTKWYAHYCADWGKSFSNGANYKHADCNGDGIVDSNDMKAVRLNYGDVHLKTGFDKTGNPNNPPFYLHFTKSMYSPGDTVNANIMLGNSSLPINNAYGFECGINFDPKYVDTSTLKLHFASSWFGTPGKDVIHFIHSNFGNSAFAFALTRIDHNNISGHGKIGSLSFIIPAGAQMDSTPPIQTIASKLISFDETVIPLYLPGDTLSVTTSIISREKAISDIALYPNPATSNLNIESNSNLIQSVTIFDATGRVNFSIPHVRDGKVNIPVNNLPAGIYFVKLGLENGSYEGKFMKE